MLNFEPIVDTTEVKMWVEKQMTVVLMKERVLDYLVVQSELKYWKV